MLNAILAKRILLDQVALQSYCNEFDAIVLHVDVEIAVSRADAAVAFYDPGFQVVECGRECYGVADELAVA